MKTIITKTALTAALTFFLLISGLLTAQAEEFKKQIDRTFEVNKNATLDLTNKFGDVHCQVWGDKKVSVKVEITVKAPNQEKANKIFDRIGVEIIGSPDRVTGVTEVGNMSFSNTEFSIDYYVMMPKSLNLELNNSFGEIFVEEVDGTAKINMEYGEMEVNALNGPNSEITVKFGEASIDYLKDGKINIEYGELDSKGANNLDIYSRFSELNIDKAESVVLDSQYDEINFGSTGRMEVVSRFSGIEIGKLNGNFNVDSQYGSFDAGYIYPGFTEGKIKVAFTGVTLTFDPKASFQVDAEIKFGSLSYPDNSSVNHKEEGYVTNLYKGTVGSNKSASARLTIDSQNGDVDLSY